MTRSSVEERPSRRLSAHASWGLLGWRECRGGLLARRARRARLERVVCSVLRHPRGPAVSDLSALLNAVPQGVGPRRAPMPRR